MTPPETAAAPAKRPAGKRTFLKGLVGSPRLTGAIAPSGAALSRLMASYVDRADPRPVLELGPGTGVVTSALIERGVARDRIVAVEFNPDFCKLLRERFDGITVIRGDAYDLAATLPAQGPFAAVISSLPLLTQPPRIRREFVKGALARTVSGGPLVQFSYSPRPPVKPVAGHFRVERSKWVMANLPPARVWVYRHAA